ncbi:hypothetical protein [Actinomyces naeslundii]|jgi:hypothetical protein|uniref:hypothetical protein n=1 Tax=Actinomyces naeslundii TaxID=1655 RepID=UPI002115DFAB|nr:hypothetical protein [Actinomyces naeslundii]
MNDVLNCDLKLLKAVASMPKERIAFTVLETIGFTVPITPIFLSGAAKAFSPFEWRAGFRQEGLIEGDVGQLAAATDELTHVARSFLCVGGGSVCRWWIRDEAHNFYVPSLSEILKRYRINLRHNGNG